jgi:trans-2,3-dihydro-3-hydroxyanthranilate isomerase
VERRLRFFTLDVFTRSAFGGKPLVVFEDADALSSAEMLALAREFNFPAAAFLYAPRDPTNSVRLRIFTAAGERPFVTHAAIGVAVLLAQTRAGEMLAHRPVVVAIEFGNTVVSCEVFQNRAGICYAEFALTGLPRSLDEAPDVAALARAVTLAPENIGFGAHAPRVCRAFERFVLAPLASLDALECARPSPADLAQILGDASGLFLYARDLHAEDAQAQRDTVYARLFDSRGAEDPANGEAAVAFAGALVEFERLGRAERQIFIEQGYAQERSGRLTLRLGALGGAAAALYLGGQAVEVAEGELKL